MANPVRFKLKGGAAVEIVTLDPTAKMGKRYDFVITHSDGSADSFIYTPASSMTEDQKNEPAKGSMKLEEQEALLIFQNTYE